MNETHVRWLLVVLVLVQLFLITAQLPDPSGQGNYLEGIALWVAAPFGRAISAGFELIGSVSSEFLLRRTLIEDNSRLRVEVEELRRQALRAPELEQQLERLSTALQYSRAAENSLRVADIVLFDQNSQVQSLTVRVRGEGLRINQPVVAGQGLVGRIVVVSKGYAKAQLITDRLASVGAMIERTRRQGIVRGAGEVALELDFVPVHEDVRVGDRVVTAGIDGVFPRGLPVGTVANVSPGGDLFHKIEMVPAVDFGKLDHVYILDSVAIPEEDDERLTDALG